MNQSQDNPFEADGGRKAIQQLFAEKNTKEGNYKEILAFFGSKLTSTYTWKSVNDKHNDESSRSCFKVSLFALSSAWQMLKHIAAVYPIQSEEGGMTDADLAFLIQKTEKILNYCQDQGFW